MIKNENTSISSVCDKDNVIGKIMKGLVKVYEVFKSLPLSGIPPLTLPKCKGVPLLDYKIYGESVQESDNLFNKDTMLSGFLPMAGTYPQANSGYTEATYQIIEMKKGQIFKISYTGDNAVNGRVRYIDNDTNEIVGTISQEVNDYFTATIGQNNGFKDGTITAKKDFKLGFLYLYTKPSNFNLQVISTVPIPEAPIEVESVGDKTNNLFNVKTIMDNTYIYGVTGQAVSSDKKQASDYIHVKGLSNISFNYAGSFAFYDENKTFISGEGKSVTTFRNYTVPENAVYIRFDWLKETITPDKIMAVAGSYTSSTMPKYEPYGYKIPVKVSNSETSERVNIILDEPLRKIGDYADYIDFKNKKVVRKIYSKVCTGAEPVSFGARSMALQNLLPASISGNSTKVVAMCNRYKSSDWESLWRKGYGTSYTDTQGIAASTTTIRIIDMLNYPNADTDATQTSLFKEWLAELYANGTPMVIDYVLEKSIEETIELPNIPTHKGTTIIEVDTSILPSNMGVVYKGKEV